MNPLTNPPSNTVAAVLADAAGPVDALDAILRQIVNGYFVLTDGQGSVSKWSEPAELLFAQPFDPTRMELSGEALQVAILYADDVGVAQREFHVERDERS